MALSISYKLDNAFDSFLDNLYDIERDQWDGDHGSFRNLLTKHFGSDVEDAYHNWYEEGED